jgi:lipoate-protein ligase A
MQLRFFCQEQISPSVSRATDQFFLQAVGNTQTAMLRVYSQPGDQVVLGRYHGLGTLAETDQVTVARRLSGGRVVPSGDGFVQFSLILPHRSAPFSDEPYHFAPFQVLNRHVRGLLHGLKTAGIDVFYPGRDLLTVQQHPLGWISFSVEDNGAVLCEGGVSVQHDFSLLPYLLDRIDPNGTISSQFFMPDQVTSIERLTGTAATFPHIARLIRNGYAEQPDFACIDEDLSQTEREQINRLAADSSDAWLHSWPLRSDLAFHATTAIALGNLDIRFSVAPEQTPQTIKDIQLSGDFLAPPATIMLLQNSLRGCPLEYTALWEVVEQTFLQPQHFILGLRHMRIIPDTILKGYTGQL